jgi:hypothetical protein
LAPTPGRIGNTFHRRSVPIDGSALSRKIITAAVKFARICDGKIVGREPSADSPSLGPPEEIIAAAERFKCRMVFTIRPLIRPEQHFAGSNHDVRPFNQSGSGVSGAPELQRRF